MRDGHNQYAPMPGVLALREGIAAKVEQFYGPTYDPVTEVVVTSGATAGLYATLTTFVQPGRRSALVRAVLRLVCAGDPLERRHAGVRQPALSRLLGELGRGPPRDHAADARDSGQHAAQPDRHDVVGRRHAAAPAIVDGTNIILIGDEVYEHIIFDGRRHESLLRYPDLRARSVVISSFGKTFHTTGWKVGYCVGPQPLIAEVTRVHQFMTFTVHTPSQIAFAEFVRKDPSAKDLAPFYQQKRDLFLQLTAGSRFRPLPCAGTYFQLFDYSAISNETDKEIAHRLIVEHGVASIPGVGVPLQGQRRPGAAVLLCEEGRNAAGRGRAAGPDLTPVVASSRTDSGPPVTSHPQIHTDSTDAASGLETAYGRQRQRRSGRK